MSARGVAGMTLVEVMVGIAVMAVLYGMAMPEYRAWLWNTRIRTATESLNYGLQLARAEAVRRNTNVLLTLTSTDSSWVVGCEIPLGDLNADGKDDCPATIQSHAAGEGMNNIAVTVTPADATTITFNGFGQLAANSDASASITQLDVDTPLLSAAQSRDLRLLFNGGSVRACEPNITTTGDPGKC